MIGNVFDDQSLLYFIHSKRNAIKTIFFTTVLFSFCLSAVFVL